MRGRDLLKKIGARRLGMIGRYREIVSILIKYGFDELFSFNTSAELGEKKGAFFSHLFGRGTSHRPTSQERVRMALEELGPTFIKLGQILSNRPDMLPAELIEELKHLQDSITPMSREQLQSVLSENLPGSLDEIFTEFNWTPIAAASIGQVHTGQLLSGERVAIKVLRPSVARIINADIDIMLQLAALAEKYNSTIAQFKPLVIIEEFRRTILKEVNFLNEASHMQRFAENFRQNKKIKIPNIYSEYTTSSLLVMEYIGGIKPNEVEKLVAASIDLKGVARSGAALVLEQVFSHGFFHADPHPGNIRVLEDGRICFLDFGMMGSMIPIWRRILGQGMIALAHKDYERLTDALLQLTGSKDRGIRDRLMIDVQEFVEKYSYLSLKSIDSMGLSRELFGMIKKYQLSFPYTVYLLIKSIVTIEGIARQLDPDFNLMDHMKPYVTTMIKEQMSPKKIMESAAANSFDLVTFLSEIPMESKDFFRTLKEGQIQIQFMHRGLEDLSHRIDRSAQKLSYAIVMGALIAGSTMIIVARIPPFWHSVPFLGIVGLGVAFLLGIRIVMKK